MLLYRSKAFKLYFNLQNNLVQLLNTGKLRRKKLCAKLCTKVFDKLQGYDASHH